MPSPDLAAQCEQLRYDLTVADAHAAKAEAEIGRLEVQADLAVAVDRLVVLAARPDPDRQQFVTAGLEVTAALLRFWTAEQIPDVKQRARQAEEQAERLRGAIRRHRDAMYAEENLDWDIHKRLWAAANGDGEEVADAYR